MSNKLTKSPRLNHLLYEMGIYSAYDVISLLPRRYDDFSYTPERNLVDKQKVVLLGKVISVSQLVKHRGLSLVKFEFMTLKGTYFRVIAFNRPYLIKIITVNETYTLIGVFDKKNNEINMVNIVKGEIS